MVLNGRIDAHQQFVNQYDIDNFQSQMTAQDVERYNQYQQNINQNMQENDLGNPR